MIRVQREDFDVAAETRALIGDNRRIGAVVTFTGLVRDFVEPGGAADAETSAETDVDSGAKTGAGLSDAAVPAGAAETPIRGMTLEHYPGMTERVLAEIEAEARARWALDGVAIIHRYGPLAPGEQIVLVITTSAHRGEAFAAAAFLMDFLKSKAPFWKLEQTPDGGRWVDARDSDDAAAARWRVAAAD